MRQFCRIFLLPLQPEHYQNYKYEEIPYDDDAIADCHYRYAGTASYCEN